MRTRDPATRSLASFPPDLFSNLPESKDESSMLSSSPCRCTVFMLESRAVERRCRQLSVHPPPPLLAHLALTLPCRYCCIVSTTFPPWVTSRGVHAPPLWVRFPFFSNRYTGFCLHGPHALALWWHFPFFLDLWGVPLEFYFALSIYLVLFGDSFHFCPMAGLH